MFLFVQNDADEKIAKSRPKVASQKEDKTEYHYHCPSEDCPYFKPKKHFSSMKLLKQVTT